MSTEIHQVAAGNNYKLEFLVSNSDSTPRNLTGTTDIQFAISRWSSTEILVSASLADQEVAIVDEEGGRITVQLTSGLLNSLPRGRLYYYELNQTNSLGESITVATGYFHLLDRIIEN